MILHNIFDNIVQSRFGGSFHYTNVGDKKKRWSSFIKKLCKDMDVYEYFPSVALNIRVVGYIVMSIQVSVEWNNKYEMKFDTNH